MENLKSMNFNHENSLPAPLHSYCNLKHTICFWPSGFYIACLTINPASSMLQAMHHRSAQALTFAYLWLLRRENIGLQKHYNSATHN